MKRGLNKLTKKELGMLNKTINGCRIVSFYAKDGAILNNKIPSIDQLRSFKRKHGEIYALDGSLVKSIPSSGNKMFKYLESHCISSKMREAVSEETMKLNQSVKDKVLERDGYTCSICGSKEKLCVDHIFPVSRGGFTELDNLRVLCEKCNLQKSNRTENEFNEWRQKHGKTT